MAYFLIIGFLGAVLVLDCNIIYKKGETHTNVDALSRLIEVKQEVILAVTRSQNKTIQVEKSNHENNQNHLNTKEKDNTLNQKTNDKQAKTKKHDTIIQDYNKITDVTKILNDTEIKKTNNDKKLIESYNSESTDDENEIVSKDPFQNKNLLHYLKHLKLKSGLSKSESKKIVKMAQNYIYNNINVIYNKNGSNKVVPPIEKRHEIIKTAHLIGHFQSETTYNRLREKYYWPKMLEQIKSVISQCSPCIRNEPHQTSHLKAQALSIVNIFDRVSIDLVLGLPTSKSGNNVICVMVEHLTGFCLVKPTKSKEAKEIVKVLWEWISIFGPMKVLLSDQGGEFCNKLIDELLNLIGTEHRVTSSYHPE